jgi:hypothetical protein
MVAGTQGDMMQPKSLIQEAEKFLAYLRGLGCVGNLTKSGWVACHANGVTFTGNAKRIRFDYVVITEGGTTCICERGPVSMAWMDGKAKGAGL